ncbi:MAG: hypothetical protein SFU27_05785 [Thermonemataceae bacterium]|nr:hypothetical protein [Thermonemataceae bacterium]
MKEKKKHINELHFEHKLWQSEANFFTDELKIYQNRLEEIATKNTGDEISKKISHFQNQFIIQKEQLDILNHEIKVHEQYLSGVAQENTNSVDHKLFDNHGELEDKANTFRKLYAELKQEFMTFLAQSM